MRTYSLCSCQAAVGTNTAALTALPRSSSSYTLVARSLSHPTPPFPPVLAGAGLAALQGPPGAGRPGRHQRQLHRRPGPSAAAGLRAGLPVRVPQPCLARPPGGALRGAAHRRAGGRCTCCGAQACQQRAACGEEAQGGQWCGGGQQQRWWWWAAVRRCACTCCRVLPGAALLRCMGYGPSASDLQLVVLLVLLLVRRRRPAVASAGARRACCRAC